MLYRRIRDLRKDRDLTQKKLAQVFNCSQQVYSNMRLGNEIPADTLIKPSALYNVAVDSILGISDISKIQK